MASANSRLRVHVETSDFEQLTRAVLAGRLEFAVSDTTSAERHPTRLAIEPVAEHRVFFYVRQGHPLAAARETSLETVLVFPLVAPRLPQRMAGHLAKISTSARVDRETGDLTPSLTVDNFSIALKTVLTGDAVGFAPLVALEQELRSQRIALLPFTAPWLHMSYGLFYPRKRALSRVAQLFMTQLRQVEVTLQTREQRAISRLEAHKKRPRRTPSRAKAGTAAAAPQVAERPAPARRARRRRTSHT
jgi:DNA-binding transcriptional LysR family regulator